MAQDQRKKMGNHPQRPSGCPRCGNQEFSEEGNCKRCKWNHNYWQCRIHNMWMSRKEEPCPVCIAEYTQKRSDGLELARCSKCDQQFHVRDGGCPVCTVRCNNPGCGYRYSSGLTQCPRCTLVKKFDLLVVTDRDDARREWELRVTFFATFGDEQPKPYRARVLPHDPLSANDEKEIPPEGTALRFPYSESYREIRFSLVSSEVGNPGVVTKVIPLKGIIPEFRKVEYDSSQSFLENVKRAWKGA